MPIVRPRRPRLASPSHSSRDIRRSDRLQLAEVGDVLVERRLARVGLRRAGLRLDRRVVAELRARLQERGRARRRSGRRAAPSSARWSWPIVRRPSSRQPLRRLRADPGHPAGRRGREALARLLAPHRHQARPACRGRCSTSRPGATARRRPRSSRPSSLAPPRPARAARAAAWARRSGPRRPRRAPSPARGPAARGPSPRPPSTSRGRPRSRAGSRPRRGHSRRAREAGIAEPTPNLRAS